MTHATNRLGRLGEELATRHLTALGYDIEARNWRAASGAVRGEIDLVARDGSTLVFCEVKARRRAGPLSAFAAVSPAKQRQLRRLAALYLAGHRAGGDVRFDVVAVSWPLDGGAADVDHLVGAF